MTLRFFILRCYYHGHPKCYSATTFNKLSNKTMGAIYFEHSRRMKNLKHRNPSIVEIWECEFEALLKVDPAMREIVLSSKIVPPINPRHALYGGRTNAIKLYHECENDEQIKYIDFTSLYPSVQKQFVFPTGHPVITRSFDNLDTSQYFGLIKCSILPPKDLYLPILPLKINHKLVFALCLTCATQKLDSCDHSEAERVLKGTWVSEEVKLAVEHGYEIKELFEVWHFPDKSTTLFSGYVDTFIKAKTESSGYPAWVTSEQDKLKYKQLYLEKENVELEEISFNPAKRSFSKICLNSQWGYLAMDSDRSCTKIINKPSAWFLMAADDNIEIENVHLYEKCLMVNYSEKQFETGRHTSVVHASFVTAYGRIKLYKEMAKLGDRLLYFDTDSIVYVSRPGSYDPPLGDYLGEFTNELDPKKGNFIKKFVSAGPKNYAYSTDTGTTKTVVKGISINKTTMANLNFESIKDIVLHDQSKKIAVEQLKFTIDKPNCEIHSGIVNKSYGFVYDKRILRQDLTTVPYGFRL